jgi:hypothetical protein
VATIASTSRLRPTDALADGTDVPDSQRAVDPGPGR